MIKEPPNRALLLQVHLIFQYCCPPDKSQIMVDFEEYSSHLRSRHKRDLMGSELPIGVSQIHEVNKYLLVIPNCAKKYS